MRTTRNWERGDDEVHPKARKVRFFPFFAAKSIETKRLSKKIRDLRARYYKFMRKRKDCTCPCHRHRAVIHVVPCCDGMPALPRLRKKFESKESATRPCDKKPWVTQRRGFTSLMGSKILAFSIACCLALVACRREATPPLQSNVPATTPLMVAAAKGDVASVRGLLRGGARINDADRDGYTALHRASHCGDIRVVKTLIAAGADINARTKENVSPLLVSIDMGCGKPEITMALIQAGADVNVAESDGDTAIVIAATESSLDVMRELLKRGANPNAQGINGETALHYAAMNNLLDRVELLLQAGARVDIRDSAGKTALEEASPEAKKLLERVVKRPAKKDSK
jgi:ankyrin repeat protein